MNSTKVIERLDSIAALALQAKEPATANNKERLLDLLETIEDDIEWIGAHIHGARDPQR